MELIGTKEGEDCMEGEGGGGIVVEGGYGGEGRRKEDTTAWPNFLGDVDSWAIRRILRAAAATHMRKLYSSRLTQHLCRENKFLPRTLSQADDRQ